LFCEGLQLHAEVRSSEAGLLYIFHVKLVMWLSHWFYCQMPSWCKPW